MASGNNQKPLRGYRMSKTIKKLLDELAALLRRQEPGAADRAIEAIKNEESRKDGEKWTN
jgi:predicted transcriptional regulator